MTESEAAKVNAQIQRLATTLVAAPHADLNDGNDLFEYCRTLIDEACGIQTVLLEIWSSRKPPSVQSTATPKPTLESVLDML